MAGTAQLTTNEQGEKVLLLQSEVGKGDKAIFLKALNKQLLKTTGAQAELVEELPVVDPVESGSSSSEEPMQDSASAENIKRTGSAQALQALSTTAKGLMGAFKDLRGEYDRKEASQLAKRCAKWMADYKALPAAFQPPLKTVKEHLDKVVAQTNKILLTDRQIDKDTKILFKKLEQYNNAKNLDAPAIIDLKKQLLEGLQDLEKRADFIKDQPLLVIARQYQEELN